MLVWQQRELYAYLAAERTICCLAAERSICCLAANRTICCLAAENLNVLGSRENICFLAVGIVWQQRLMFWAAEKNHMLFGSRDCSAAEITICCLAAERIIFVLAQIEP